MMKNSTNHTIIIALLFINAGAIIAQANSHDERLPWVNGKLPPNKGNYEYVVSNGQGETLSEARSTAVDRFLINLGNLAGVTLDSKTKGELKMNIEQGEHVFRHEESRTMTNTFNINRKEVTVSYTKVSEYYEYVNGYYHLWELYEVSKLGTFKPYIPEYTDRYGASAAWKSAILPGWGQFYMGKTVKGAIFLTAEVAVVSGLVYSEMRRSDNVRLSQETTNTKVIKEYRDRADTWALRRNICIGVAVGVYAWSVIDAALSKGKIRYAWIPNNLHFEGSESLGNYYVELSYHF